MKCGCSEVRHANIREWEKLYKRRYGHKFVERNPDLPRTKIYDMTLQELMKEVYDSPLCMEMIEGMYPNLCKGITHADAVLLFFDRAIKDGRLDEIRELLIKNRQ